MTTLDSLLRAILLDPADDALRLVYADALSDAGEEERAEFIRLQCEITRMDEEGEGVLDENEGHTCVERDCPVCKLVAKYDALKARERQLLVTRGCDWLVELFPSMHTPCYLTREPAIEFNREWQCVFRRGFVEEVRTTLALWLTHGPAIVACQPVTKVVLTDREPVGPLNHVLNGVYQPVWCWDCYEQDSAETLPACLFALLEGEALVREGRVMVYRDRKTALAALFAACVSHARSQANLPPLAPSAPARAD